MRTFTCVCGSALFFENSQCLECGRDVGWCPKCRSMVALLPESGTFRCANGVCGTRLLKCANYLHENVCNRCVEIGSDQQVLCDCCRLTDTIPDLSVQGNRDKWYRLEAAKRRLVYDLNLLGLPLNGSPRLAFDFKADIQAAGFWRTMSEQERVYTGHANGKITINIREADSAEREKLRIDLGEAHRTLIGHFRHEIGHYYWEALVQNKREPEFRQVFGDHDNPPYAEALERYYAQGPPAGWQHGFVSAYASMHPWEDFAETFALYLDVVSVLDTSHNMGIGGPGGTGADLDQMVPYYQRLGIFLNEMNRAMGLVDFVPEVLHVPIIEKMRFIHRVVVEAGMAPMQTAG